MKDGTANNMNQRGMKNDIENTVHVEPFMQSVNNLATGGTFKIDTMPDMFSNPGMTPSSINEG